MLRRWCTAGFLSASLFILAPGPSFSITEGISTPRPWAAKIGPALPPSDTLRASTSTDTPLILSLPDEVDGVSITRYSVLEGPSLSGVAGRSFTWILQETDPGTYDVRLQVHHSGAEPDTLVLRIDVEP